MAVKQTCILGPGGKNSAARSGSRTGTQGGGHPQRHRGKEILTLKDNPQNLAFYYVSGSVSLENESGSRSSSVTFKMPAKIFFFSSVSVGSKICIDFGRLNPDPNGGNADPDLGGQK